MSPGDWWFLRMSFRVTSRFSSWTSSKSWKIRRRRPRHARRSWSCSSWSRPLDEEDEDDEAADELDDDELDEPAALELEEAVLEPEPGAAVEELAACRAPAGFASSHAADTSPTASVPPVSNFRNSRRSSRRGSALPSRWALSLCGIVLPGVSARRGAHVTSHR
jgi:hypothetical protein